MTKTRDHGGGLDAAVAAYGGTRADWLDLSTGINPVPYPVGDISPDAWTALPDQGAMDRLLAAARAFWNVPEGAEIVAANGASAIIAQMPYIRIATGPFFTPEPTYNEHAAAFDFAGVPRSDPQTATTHIYVHPNNPDGRTFEDEIAQHRDRLIIDESFSDVSPHRSKIALSCDEGVIILKSFGKFWGLAGMRLGFAIGTPTALFSLRERLGPWSVSGPALEIGARALEDTAWAEATRVRLAADAKRLDELVGWKLVGGTDLFRTYEVEDAAAVQDHLAHGHVWSRIFPYSKTWIRLGLPAPDSWGQLEAALKGLN